MPIENNKADLKRQIEELTQRNTNLAAALEKSETNFRILTESAPVGIYLNDTQGKAIYINNKCAKLVGVPAEKALDFDWAKYLHPDDRERVFLEWQKSVENNAEFHSEYRYVHSDGKVVWTLGDVIPLLGDDGKATMYIGTLTDITARKKSELETQALEKKLTQAQKLESIGRLAGGVAHDYNNMLNIIINYGELALAEVEESDSVHQKLQQILKAATRSAKVTRQLLSFAREQVIFTEVFDINHAVNDIIDMLKRLITEDIDLAWLPHAGKILIKMDQSQLDQVVVNLCLNARDAIAGVGKITIKTSAVTSMKALSKDNNKEACGEFALLTISDNGSGMDKATLGNIFEPFFTTKNQGEGTGLGLPSVFGAVKQNKGTIEVNSEVGAGTTFKIYLPIYKGELSKDRAITPITTQDNRGETILIVEDEVPILDIVTIILEDLHYKVLSASNSSEAFELADKYNGEIDLLITDVIMPGMNGADLANVVRENRPDIQCLYMSGYTADVIADKGVLEEKVNFIQKPFKMNDLIAKVREILNKT